MIGVFGGTFDPVHFGHLRPALDCLQALALDEVRFVPVSVAVHRPQPQAAGRLRLRMIELAIADQPGFRVDGRELHRPGRSYSFDTLTSLRAEVGPDRPLCLLVGDDAFAGFLDWHRPVDILGLAHLVVMRRPGAAALAPALQDLYAQHACDQATDLASRPGGLIWFQTVTQLDIAATRVRDLIRRGLDARYLVPDAVLALIAREGLYREPLD